jgi:hypothetical protein
MGFCPSRECCRFHIYESSIYLKLIHVRDNLTCPMNLTPKYSSKTRLEGDVFLKKIISNLLKISTFFLYPPLLLFLLLFISFILFLFSCPSILSSSSSLTPPPLSRFHWTSSMYSLFFSSLSLLYPRLFSYIYHSFVLFFILSLIIVFFILISIIFSVLKNTLR